ncbi:MAG TPA: hypothetical protein DCW52_07410 [Gammaproteobacteria bacterium]|nr:hypothetical protein [Gammaproteobacteria bacterium]
MFKKWFGRNMRSDIFELLTEDDSVQNQHGTTKISSAQLGQLEALSKSALVRYADQQSEKIKALTQEVGFLSRQNALHIKLRDQRDTSMDASKQLAHIERERESEAQYQRDQFQIRMKELSLRVGELEAQLLHSNIENGRLKSLLRKLRDQIAPNVTETARVGRDVEVGTKVGER